MKMALLTNLLHSKTGHINVGDVFIRKGLQCVLEAAIEEKIDWDLISRFTPLSDEKLERIKKCRYIVYGGMPQYNNLDDWKFYYDDGIWDDLNSTGVDVLRLAGGGGGSGENITPKQYASHLNSSKITKEILKKSLKNCKIVTTRDRMAQEFLDSNNIKSQLLPCPGSFAMYKYGATKTDKKINAICLTASFFKNSKKEEELIKEFKKTKTFLEKQTNKPTKIICQVKKSDLSFLEKHFDKKDIIVENEPEKIIDTYKHVDICVTTRLHCALPIWGIGGRSVLVRVDTRGIAGEEIDLPIVNLHDYTHTKFKEIYENDKFSKVKPSTSFKECVNFYKAFFKK